MDGTSNGGANDDDGQDGGSSSGGVIANPSYKDLGNGVIIRHQTSTNLLIEITPDTPAYTASAWDGSYEDVEIPGTGARIKFLLQI